MGDRRTRQSHEAVVLEITYALLSSVALAAAVGLAFYATAWALGVADSHLVEVVAAGLVFGLWGGRTLLVLLRFDRTRRAAL